MSERYYLQDNGQQQGPFPMAVIASLWQNGKLSQNTIYCREGEEHWMPLINSTEMAAFFPAVEQPKQQSGCVSIIAITILLFFGVWVWSNISSCWKPERPKTSVSAGPSGEERLAAIRAGEAAGRKYGRENRGFAKAEHVVESLSAKGANDAGYSGRLATAYQFGWKKGFKSTLKDSLSNPPFAPDGP